MILVAAIIASMAAASQPLMTLDGLIDFRSARTCTTGDTLGRLEGSVHAYKGDEVVLGVPVVPPRFRGAIGEPVLARNQTWTTITLPVRGRWHGLPVEALIWTHYDGGDPLGFQLRFRAPARAARAALNRLGFALPERGERQVEDGYTTAIGVKSTATGSELYCFVG